MQFNNFHPCPEHFFNKSDYYYNNPIESNELKEGQLQKDAEKLILENIKKYVYGKTDSFTTPFLDFIEPYEPLKKGHNMVCVNIEAANFKLQVDFHINLIVS